MYRHGGLSKQMRRHHISITYNLGTGCISMINILTFKRTLLKQINSIKTVKRIAAICIQCSVGDRHLW